MILVFVYGTLKRGRRNFHHLRDASYLGDHVTEPGFTLFSFDTYPAACRQGHQSIHGELFRVTAPRLLALDRFEGHPDYYQRIRIDTEFGKAWMYVMHRQHCHGRRRIEGIW